MSKKKSTSRAKLKVVSQEDGYTCWKNISKICCEKNPKFTDEPITKIINNQQDIKLRNKYSMYNDEKWKRGKLLILIFYHQNYRKRENLMIYYSDTLTSKLTRTQLTDEQKAVSSLSPRKVILELPKLPRYNPYFHSSWDLQCSAIQQNRTRFWENLYEESKCLLEKLIINSNSDTLRNSRRFSSKQPWGDTLICWFLQVIWLRTQREDE